MTKFLLWVLIPLPITLATKLAYRSKIDELMMACRHHIYEIVLRAVFDSKFSASSAPEVSIFERFTKAWNNIDQSSYRSVLEDDNIRSKITDEECDQIKHFCRQKLDESHSRNDYKEFLELVLVFLGEDAVGFRQPGPTSHSRGMAKGTYNLKIFIFRYQFHLTPRELDGIRDTCIFLLRIYIRAWFGCTNAIAAPNQDLNFVNDSAAFAKIDLPVSAAILKKNQKSFVVLITRNSSSGIFRFERLLRTETENG